MHTGSFEVPSVLYIGLGQMISLFHRLTDISYPFEKPVEKNKLKYKNPFVYLWLKNHRYVNGFILGIL
jgi:hypothetical protein